MDKVREFFIPARVNNLLCAEQISNIIKNHYPNYEPVRVSLSHDGIEASLNIDDDDPESAKRQYPQPTRAIFKARTREYVNENNFNVALVIPTGIGASTGGHAGDANVLLKSVASIADHVFTHPNVVNASDLNEIPDNASYVEGSILSRFLLGSIFLSKTRSNRILVIHGKHDDERYINALYNAVNASRVTFGSNIYKVIESPTLKTDITFSKSGRASGLIDGLDELKGILLEYKGKYDAVALASIVNMDYDVLNDYYASEEDRINPIGGVEAMLTHWVSTITNLQSAHSPLMENNELDNTDFGIVDARLSAELISTTYFGSVLKGLTKAPKVTNQQYPGCFSTSDVHAIIMPMGCLGLPVYAALSQDIPFIAVRDNIQTQDMSDVVRNLPWSPGQYIEADDYLQAMGILSTIKSGVSLDAIRRPIRTMTKLNSVVKTKGLREEQ